MKIYIVRHGETDWNSSGRWQGVTDIPLNQKGIEQSGRIAQKLAGHSISRIYTSPLARTLRTAEIIHKSLGAEIVVDDAIHEIIMGEWTGLSLLEMENTYGALYAEWNAGGPAQEALARYGVESLPHLRERACAALQRICKAERDDFLIVAHGTWTRALLCGLFLIPLNERSCFEIGNTTINILDYDGPSNAFKLLPQGALV